MATDEKANLWSRYDDLVWEPWITSHHCPGHQPGILTTVNGLHIPTGKETYPGGAGIPALSPERGLSSLGASHIVPE